MFTQLALFAWNMRVMKSTDKPQTIDEYIAREPAEVQKKLREVRAAVRKGAPGAEESLKWGMPAFSAKRILVMFGAFKSHIGFYPTPSAIRAFAKQLSKFKGAKGSVQFPFDKPLPLALIQKITAFRWRESNEADPKWQPSSR